MRTARFSCRLGVGMSAQGVGVWLGGVYNPLWTEWLTDRCTNITLPQTSFAGGNKGYDIPPGTAALVASPATNYESLQKLYDT